SRFCSGPSSFRVSSTVWSSITRGGCVMGGCVVGGCVVGSCVMDGCVMGSCAMLDATLPGRSEVRIARCSSGFFCLLPRRLHNNDKVTIKGSTNTPPTVPPAIAATFLLPLMSTVVSEDNKELEGVLERSVLVLGILVLGLLVMEVWVLGVLILALGVLV